MVIYFRLILRVRKVRENKSLEIIPLIFKEYMYVRERVRHIIEKKG